MPDVFLCHAASDAATVLKISDFLEKEKISCWSAPRDLATVGNESLGIDDAIAACPVMVLIVSQEANSSTKLQVQVEQALRAEKILIPLRIENVTPTGRLEVSLRHRFRHDAFVGPLERHLPELVRMLKPLLHRLVVKTRDATSISRTLPSRSSIVRGVDESKSGSANRPVELLEVAIHFPNPLFAGHSGSVELKVRGDAALSGEATVTLEGLGLKRPATLKLGNFRGQPEQRHRLAIKPSRSGIFPLHVTVMLDDQNRRMKLTGVRRLRINQAHLITDLVREEEVMVNHADADLFLAAAKAGQPGLPVSELLAIEVPENFEHMHLSREFEVGRWAIESLKITEALRCHPDFQGKGQSGTLLRLEPELAAPELPFQEIRLVARTTFTVGRQRDESDYLAWFWPRNDVHDTKTRRVSKKHCAFLREGATTGVRGLAAGSLTTFDGQDLSGSDVLVLDGIGTLNLSGIYEIAVARFASTLISTAPSQRDESPRGSVSFVSRTPNTLPQNALWLLTDGSFGSSAANPLRLDIPSVADIQGRFHYDQGHFWLESVLDNRAVEVEEITLTRGFIVPLAQGMKVRLGDLSFRVAIEG